jgi:hypothetical protein
VKRPSINQYPTTASERASCRPALRESFIQKFEDWDAIVVFGQASRDVFDHARVAVIRR